MAECKSNIKLTKDTPYLTLTGELWGVFCEDFEENWPCYNDTALYYGYSSVVMVSHELYHTIRNLLQPLTHWGQVTHTCVSKLSIIGPDNGLLPGWHKAIIWTNAGILLTGPLGTNLSEILIEILRFSFKKMCLKMLCAKWQLSSRSLNMSHKLP